MKKLLIIDEKDHHANGSGKEFYRTANESCKNLIEIVEKVEDVISLSSDIEVKLKFLPEEYEWVFFHDSYHDKNLDEGQLEDFKSKLNNCVLFSGGKAPNYRLQTTNRFMLFNGLENALMAYRRIKHFPIKTLFDSNYNVYYPLLDILEDYLTDSDDTSLFLQSAELKLMLSLLNYTEEVIATKILPRYERHSQQELYQKIEDWRRKNF